MNVINPHYLTGQVDAGTKRDMWITGTTTTKNHTLLCLITIPKHTPERRQLLQYMMLEKLDAHLQLSKTRFISITLHNNPYLIGLLLVYIISDFVFVYGLCVCIFMCICFLCLLLLFFVLFTCLFSKEWENESMGIAMEG